MLVCSTVFMGLFYAYDEIDPHSDGHALLLRETLVAGEGQTLFMKVFIDTPLFT